MGWKSMFITCFWGIIEEVLVSVNWSRNVQNNGDLSKWIKSVYNETVNRHRGGNFSIKKLNCLIYLNLSRLNYD